MVVLSDHGVYGDDELDRFRNLIIARTPGHPGLLGDAPTPINVLPRILNAYLGTGLNELPDTLFDMETGTPGSRWSRSQPIVSHTSAGKTTSLSSRYASHQPASSAGPLVIGSDGGKSSASTS